MTEQNRRIAEWRRKAAGAVMPYSWHMAITHFDEKVGALEPEMVCGRLQIGQGEYLLRSVCGSVDGHTFHIATPCEHMQL